jgi:toxin ParE1/3/4
MSRVTRDRAAQRDLDEIWDYIAQESVAAANRLIDMIVETCNRLALQSEMGRLRPELASNLRSFTVGNYVIFYRPTQDGIEVARMLHGARDIEALLRANP